ncbi:2-Methylisocitrate lyase, PEP mutase family [Kosakonia arachidis]|uniref:2-Methylisocitrate lyase, PEP mutase family n=1 Tax=Kosakonia arachidis TaxID=551989 RepID=A0A1I7AXH4_9ENTR|nr:isocitrate lyase/phosphoenolpyruvate mutase family protein [Kosakonia arachidis]SFT79581.1 2-Methylisocitrate lyase, PEP mutase family [Kosakonia arachidis]
MDFTTLHHQSTPLLLGNVWDAASSRAAQQAGYQALGTSSAAIAAMLGYDDGEQMTFAELLFVVKRIRAACDLPLSVDMEAGYGETAQQITENLQQLAQLGVVGVNLEDSRVVKGERQLLDARLFAERLRAIRANVPDALFLNIRTDTFLLKVENALAETLYRGQLYAEQGAKGLFVPCVVSSADIAAIARHVPLPLNVMCMPELAAFADLAQLGVRRISMGNVIHAALQTRLNHLLLAVQTQQSFGGVFRVERD